jgi:hypothetical protein
VPLACIGRADVCDCLAGTPLAFSRCEGSEIAGRSKRADIHVPWGLEVKPAPPP